MKKIAKLIVCCFACLLAGCSKNDGTTSENTTNNIINNTSQNNSVVEQYLDTWIENQKNSLAKFSITREDGKDANYTYDSDKDEYVIKVESSKAKYVLSGYTESHFIISNSDNLTSFKGVNIKLVNACIVSKNSYVPIHFAVDSKNIELSIKNSTTNYLVTTNGSNCLESNNNIEIDGKGTLNLYTRKTKDDNSDGHCIKASNKIYVYEKPDINFTSQHDGIHCDEIHTFNKDDIEKNEIDDKTHYSGTMTFNNIKSQAIEGTTKKCSGSIELSGGKYVINGVDSVFKTDKEVKIASGVEVTATNVKNYAIVKQTQEEVDENITIPACDIVVEGSFTCNGIKIESQKI